MKLSEIMPTHLNEGRVPVVVKMTIQEIVKYGKITNFVQAYELANSIVYLQNAKDPTEWSLLDEYRDKTLNHNTLVSQLRNATPEVQVALAQEILMTMNDHDQIGVLGTSSATVNFINGVLHAQ